MSVTLLPPRKGTCPICGKDHPPHFPHDALSLYYQYRFHASRARWPTWADAIAHCTPEMQAHWRTALQQGGHWSEPTDGSPPIADPPHDSLRMPMTDMPGFEVLEVRLNPREEHPDA